jgi:hypothetical protein
VLVWAWGEAVWTGYEVVLGEEVPFPSLADVGFLSLPLLAGIGLLVWPMGLAGGRDRLAALLEGALIGAALLVISWATSLGATIRAGGASTTGTVISAAYPVGDVIMTALVGVLLTRAASTNRVSLVLLSGGLVLLAVADSAFMYGTSTGSYSSGGLLDAGWFAGFLAIGVAGTALGASPASGTHRRHLTGRRRLVPPYLLAGAAMLTVVGTLLGGGSLPPVETLGALIIVLALVARESLLARENRELAEALEAVQA